VAFKVKHNSSNVSIQSLFPNIPDTIFTTSKTKGTIFSGNYNNERLYSYIQFNYVGTQNIETDIVVLDWPHYYNTTTGAVNQLKISYNTSVVYNVTTKALGIAPVPSAYFKITNATIKTGFTNPSTSNCFISFENQETSSGINFNLGSIIEATLKWVPQAKTILWAKATLQSMASSKTATKLFFWSTPEQQYTYYGAVMTEIKGTASNKLNKVGDSIFITGATSSSNPALTYSYTYTAAQN
jgi:hypothetical protein